MKISEVIKGLQKIKKQHGDLDCFYSEDEEGNGHHHVVYNASLMFKEKDDDLYSIGLYSFDNINEIKQEYEDDNEVFDENDFEKVCCIN